MSEDAELHGFYDDSPGLEPRGLARQPSSPGSSTQQASTTNNASNESSSNSALPPPTTAANSTSSAAALDTDLEAAGDDASHIESSTGTEPPEPYGRVLQRMLTGELNPTSASQRHSKRGPAKLLGRPRRRRGKFFSAKISHSSRPVNDAGDDAERIARQKEGSQSEKPDRRLGLRQRILHFTPSWFSVTMGTGVIANLLLLLPWPSIHSGLRYPAVVFLFADIVIFVVFLAAFISRYIMYPAVLPVTCKDPNQSMFLGTIPMGLIVIINGIAQLGTKEFSLGIGFALAASGLWFFAVFLSLLTAIGVPFSMMTYQKHAFEGTTAALLLPIVPPITAAATGSVIAEILMDRFPTYAFTMMVVSYLVLGIGLPIALLILVLYFQRLLLFKSPPRDVIISVFLPLGPCGQGGEACLHLGQVALRLFPTVSTRPDSGVPQLINVGEALYGAGLISALLLFGLGVWWLVIGLLTLLREVRRGRLQFNMGWWGLTFPLASLSICCARLAIVLDSLALKIAYTALTIAVVLLWTFVAIPTIRGGWSGRLFHAPCLANLPLKP